MRNDFYVWITADGWTRVERMFGQLADGIPLSSVGSKDKALSVIAQKSKTGEELHIGNASTEVKEVIQELEDAGYIKIVPDLPDEDMWATESIPERMGLTEEEKLKLQRPMADNPEFAATFWLKYRADAGRN